jgi:rSAM/selenodomain-associated transferase 1
MNTRIVVFAKAPAPGLAKTRLIPALGGRGAARLAKRMLECMLQQAQAADIGPVELCVTPTIYDPDWRGYRPPPSVWVSEQGMGDLGVRMARAAARGIEQDGAVLLIGTDCPALSAQRLRDAAAALAVHDAVLHPAHDGGYPLLGLRTFHSGVFEDIPWSTSTVAALTLARMEALGWCVAVGDVLRDIDEPADLIYLPEGLRLAAETHTQGDIT